MPYLSSRIKIHKTKLDRRLKLTDVERLVIIKMRTNTNYSFNKIAEIFSVSKRLVIFICNPKSLENCKKARAERGGSKIYYNKEKNTASQKEHRNYKQALYLKGYIKL